MIRAVIVDDEPDAISSLQLLLAEFCPSVEVAGTATHPVSAIKEIQSKKPDLLFLDIEIPNGSGFDILDCIGDKSFKTIFVTAYDTYTIKAIKSEAFDYLLKPVDIDELVAAIGRVQVALNKQNAAALYSSEQKLAIPISDGIYYLAIQDIIHLRAEGSYTQIYTAEGVPILVSRNLKEFETSLTGKGFCRVHNSHLVNLSHVRKFSRTDGGFVVMTNNDKIEISRNRREHFLSLISLP